MAERSSGSDVSPRLEWPTPEDTDLGRYLEDTITIDWQTPVVMERAASILGEGRSAADRLGSLFRFVRDEIAHALDADPGTTTCSASQVLAEGQGLSFAKSHLLAGMLRYSGFPTGFCYARLVHEERRSGFMLHGFNAVYWAETERWVFLDAGGRAGALRAEPVLAPPWRLSFDLAPERGESIEPQILRRPPRRIIDLLERAPDFEAVVRNLPDAL